MFIYDIMININIMTGGMYKYKMQINLKEIQL